MFAATGASRLLAKLLQRYTGQTPMLRGSVPTAKTFCTSRKELEVPEAPEGRIRLSPYQRIWFRLSALNYALANAFSDDESFRSQISSIAASSARIPCTPTKSMTPFMLLSGFSHFSVFSATHLWWRRSSYTIGRDPNIPPGSSSTRTCVSW